MQRLTYINKLGETLIFGGEGAHILAHIEGTGSPERKLAEVEAVAFAGSFISGARYQARELVAKVNLRGMSRADLYALRAKLCSVLSLEKAFTIKSAYEKELSSRLIYENNHGKWQIAGLVSDEVDFLDRVQDWQKDIKIRFKCPDPYWKALGEESISIEFNGKAFNLPFQFPIRFGRRNFEALAVNAGSIACPAKIEVHGQGEKPIIYNARTGKRIKFKNAVPTGHILKIDTNPRNLSAIIINTEGEQASAFGFLDPQYPIAEWNLAVGENKIIYEHGADAALSKIVVKWRTMLEGV